MVKLAQNVSVQSAVLKRRQHINYVILAPVLYWLATSHGRFLLHFYIL